MSTGLSEQRSQATESELEAAIALHRSGRLEEAEARYRGILARHPGDAEAMALLGVTLVQAGAPGDGIAYLERAVERQPKNATFLHNLAVAYGKTDQLEAAQGTYARAVRAGGEAVERAPGDAAAWNKLGLGMEQAGDLAGAGEAFLRAISLDAAHPLMAANLSGAFAAMLAAKERSPEAVSDVLRALWSRVQADPEDGVRWTNFVEIFRSVSVETSETAHELMPVLLACLLEERVDPQRLTRVALSVLRHHEETRALMDAAADGDAAVDEVLRPDASWAAMAHPALRLLLHRAVVPHADWERLYTRARRCLTLDRANGPVAPGMEEAAFSMARQCFHNGYVWLYEEEEEGAVEGVVRAMAGRPLGSDPGDGLRVALLASYVPLHQWERAAEVLEWSQRADNAALAELVRQQIVEPVQEEDFKELIPAFGQTATEVSERVREMYEEHPYPRWLSVDGTNPAPLADVLRTRFPHAPTARLADVTRPRILVAGCGTGKHLLGVAGRYANAEVLGVDLSRASLAYAARKAAELGFQDVSVLQADILALDAWTEPFHLIESVGVLHHMEDPMAGWRVLTRLLAPGGFMKIGLYSEAARRAVVEARAFIAEQGWSASADDIRRARPEIMRRFASSSLDSPARWRDFFSMHECRDLLFHVQEHRFTLPQIAEALQELGLEFVGWDGIEASTLARFHEQFPDPADVRNLQAWHRFEGENPDTFVSMYQFWLRKPVAETP